MLSESEDIANGVINGSVGHCLKSITESGLLRELHISDLGAQSRLFPLTIHCEIDLPSNKDDVDGYAAVTQIIEATLEMATNISTMKLSRKNMDICEKSRRKYKEEQRKAQEAEMQALREDKKREERQKEQ